MERTTIVKTLVSDLVTHLTVSGNFVRGEDSAGAVWKMVQHCAQPGLATLVMDLGGVVRLDAAGIGVLASAYRAARSHGAQVLLANTPGFIQRLLALTRLDGIFPSVQSALNGSGELGGR